MKTENNITETQPVNSTETRTETRSLVSNSDDPSEDPSDDHVEDLVLKINSGDFVLVKFITKYYIGCVISTEVQNRAQNEAGQDYSDETTYLVSFLRKVSQKTSQKTEEKTFIFPNIEDISFIEFQSVRSILNQPDIDRRERYVFNDAILNDFAEC